MSLRPPPPADTPAIEERKARWREFLAPGAPPGFLFHVNYEDPQIPAPDGVSLWRKNKKLRIERAWALYEVMCRKASLVDDDRIPYLTNATGTEIFAEAFGCKVHRPDDTNPFALPAVHTAAEADALAVPELSSSSLAYLFDIADELHQRGGPGAVMKMVDIQSPMDIAALIWDKSDLFMAMIETPEAVQALAQKVRQLLTAFLDEWFSRYGSEFIAHYPDYLMSGGITLSEDEIGAVNEDMFDQFFRSELVALSERYGGIGIHCCADAPHQWPNLRSIPGLRVINLNQPPTRPPEEYVKPAYAFFRDAAAQMHYGWAPDGPPSTWPPEYPAGSRVILDITVNDRETAVRTAEELNARRTAA